MSVMAYQITENSTVCSSTCSGIYQRKLHSSRHWPFMRGIHRWSVNSSHKRPILERGKVSVSSGHHGACTLHSLPFAWWRHQMETFSRNRPFVRGIHRGPVNSPHKGQWRAALMFSLIYVWINGWVNNREAGVLRRYRGHYDVSVMEKRPLWCSDSNLPKEQGQDHGLWRHGMVPRVARSSTVMSLIVW